MADVQLIWRGEFTSAEANNLHAAAFGTRVFSDEEWDWRALVEAHSLGWCTARIDGRLVGFANVLWDGFVHAWVQDVMVAPDRQRDGIGVAIVELATEGAASAGCEWLHVDFDPEHAVFYLERCGFRPAMAGYIQERTWHESQRLEEDPDGSVRLTMDVALGFELKAWVKGFLPDVRIVRPAELREEIARELAEARDELETPGEESPGGTV